MRTQNSELRTGEFSSVHGPLAARVDGLRISEALNADVEKLDIVRGHRTFAIVRKAASTSPSPAPQPTARALDLYLDERTTGPLILDANGQRMDCYVADRTEAIDEPGRDVFVGPPERPLRRLSGDRLSSWSCASDSDVTQSCRASLRVRSAHHSLGRHLAHRNQVRRRGQDIAAAGELPARAATRAKVAGSLHTNL